MPELTPIAGGCGVIRQSAAADTIIANHLAQHCEGDEDALYSLGVAYSTGSNGLACDLVEAHRWLNIAASLGHGDAAICRAEVADEMTAREIAEAQRRARAWLQVGRRRAA